MRIHIKAFEFILLQLEFILRRSIAEFHTFHTYLVWSRLSDFSVWSQSKL